MFRPEQRNLHLKSFVWLYLGVFRGCILSKIPMSCWGVDEFHCQCLAREAKTVILQHKIDKMKILFCQNKSKTLKRTKQKPNVNKKYFSCIKLICICQRITQRMRLVRIVRLKRKMLNTTGFLLFSVFDNLSNCFMDSVFSPCIFFYYHLAL